MTYAAQLLVDPAARRISHSLATSMRFVVAVDVVALLIRHAIDVDVDGVVDVNVVAVLVQRQLPYDNSVYATLSVDDEALDDVAAVVVGIAW